MQNLVNRLTSQLSSKGIKNSRGMAVGLLKKYGSLDEHGNLTYKGRVRQELGASGRAKSRAAKYSSKRHKASDYKYDPRTNRATVK